QAEVQMAPPWIRVEWASQEPAGRRRSDRWSVAHPTQHATQAVTAGPDSPILPHHRSLGGHPQQNWDVRRGGGHNAREGRRRAPRQRGVLNGEVWCTRCKLPRPLKGLLHERVGWEGRVLDESLEFSAVPQRIERGLAKVVSVVDSGSHGLTKDRQDLVSEG